MATDIARARRARRRATRRQRLAAWAGEIRFDFALYRPPGVLGWLAGAAMLLTPPILVVIADRMHGRWRSAARIACGAALVMASSIGLEVIALRLGAGRVGASCAFLLLPAFVLVSAVWSSLQRPPDGDDRDDDGDWPDGAA